VLFAPQLPLFCVGKLTQHPGSRIARKLSFQQQKKNQRYDNHGKNHESDALYHQGDHFDSF